MAGSVHGPLPPLLSRPSEGKRSDSRAALMSGYERKEVRYGIRLKFRTSRVFLRTVQGGS